MRTITFNELRKIKDSLPSGSMHRIADELGLHVGKCGTEHGCFLDVGEDRCGMHPGSRIWSVI